MNNVIVATNKVNTLLAQDTTSKEYRDGIIAATRLFLHTNGHYNGTKKLHSYQVPLGQAPGKLAPGEPEKELDETRIEFVVSV